MGWILDRAGHSTILPGPGRSEIQLSFLGWAGQNILLSFLLGWSSQKIQLSFLGWAGRNILLSFLLGWASQNILLSFLHGLG